MTYRRKSPLFLVLLGAGMVLGGSLIVHARVAQTAGNERLKTKRELVARLGITDLCLFTDARYTRHPSMADLHSPFQDYPLVLEHFPSGSLVPPPAHLKGHGRSP